MFHCKIDMDTDEQMLQIVVVLILNLMYLKFHEIKRNYLLNLMKQ